VCVPETVAVAVEARIAALVEARRPQLLELVRQATDKEFATLVEQELRRLAAHQAAAHGRA
jgi:hypothetical protein